MNNRFLSIIILFFHMKALQTFLSLSILRVVQYSDSYITFVKFI